MKKFVLIFATFVLMFATPVFATWGNNNDDGDQTQEQDQRQDQDQYQDQDQSQGQGQGQGQEQEANANNEGNSLVNTSTYKRPANTHLSSGRSTADHQKVRSISGGWLTGGVGLRWDATDKELRALQRADILRDRGQVSAADQLECSQKVIYKNIGGNKDDCYTLLASSAVQQPIQGNGALRDAQQDETIEALQRELAIIREEQGDCSKTANRVLQKCASK